MSGSELDDRTFRTVVEHAVNGVLIGHPDGRIFFANAAACVIFAATEHELCTVGRQGISPPDDAAWQQLLAERARTGRAVGVVPMFRLDGSPFLAEVSSSILEGPVGEGRSCVIVRDVTERVREERRLVAYDEITEALLGRLDTDEVLRLLSRHACSIFDADYAAVMVPHEGGPGARVAAAHGPGTELGAGRVFPPGGLVQRVMETAEAVIIESLAGMTRNPDIRRMDVGPGMMAPIGQPGAVMGAVFIGARQARPPYQKADLEEATRYAARAGVIIAAGHERAAIEADLRRTSEQLQHALDSRVVIEQAKGYVACLRHVGPDEAFTLLRRYARSHNTDIHSVARLVLERRLVV